jgi:3-hydroxybutyrate dehydrogenase
MGILKGKTALATGSTRSIGLACARAFASAGANIVLNGYGAHPTGTSLGAAEELDTFYPTRSPC